MMDAQQFRQLALERGYGECQTKTYAPHNDDLLHTHAFSVMLLVTEGHFTLALEDGVANYLPGDMCELAANTLHTERTGPQGASVLLARRVAAPAATHP